MSDLTPIVTESVSSPFYNKSEPVSLGKNSGSLYRWRLNSTSMQVDWTDPTLLEVYRGHHSWANTSGVVELPHKNRWTYVVIETELSVPHPIHLHGHDFVVMAQGSGTYDGEVTSLAKPPKRDTAMLPGMGTWLLLSRRITRVRGLCIVISGGIRRKALRFSLWSATTRWGP
jgi:hypothetical protein